MPLCGEIDYDSRVVLAVEDKHFPNLNFTVLARGFIGGVIVGEGQLELQGYPLAHYANCVHRINKGFRICCEKVPICAEDHSVVPSTFNRNWNVAARHNLVCLLCDGSIVYTYFRKQLPREKIVDQEFSLSAATSVPICIRIAPIFCIHQRPVNFI